MQGKLLTCMLVLFILFTGCKGTEKDPNAAFHLYQMENGESSFVRSFGWDETDALLAISEMQGVPALDSGNISNPDYIIEGVNKDAFGEIMEPLIIYLWVDRSTGQMRYYSPDASAGTAPEQIPLGPCDVSAEAAKNFMEHVLQ